MSDHLSNLESYLSAGMGIAMAQAIAKTILLSSQEMNQFVQSGGGTWDGPGMPVIHAVVDGAQIGPLAASEFTQNIQSGTIDRDTYVWMPGMDEWKPLGTVAAFQHLLNLTPPAPPESILGK